MLALHEVLVFVLVMHGVLVFVLVPNDLFVVRNVFVLAVWSLISHPFICFCRFFMNFCQEFF